MPPTSSWCVHSHPELPPCSSIAHLQGAPCVGDVLRMANVNLDLEITEICRKVKPSPSRAALRFGVGMQLMQDSLALTADDRQRIREAIERCDERYIVITHGTDTMRETAHALTGIQNKVIVITGAMQPAAFTHSDGVFNVGSAIAAVQLASPGVHISMNGRLFDPRKVRKNLDTSCYEDVH